jgi:hypothetical protein
MCSFSTTQQALAFHPDSKVKTQEAYNCVGNFLDSLEEQQFIDETISKSKNIKQKSEKNTMTNLAIRILTEQNDLHFRIIWGKIEKLGYIPPRGGKTPWATLRTGLSAKPTIFKPVGRGIYRLII